MRLTITSNTNKCPDGNILKSGEIVVNERCCGFGRIPRAARDGLPISFEQQAPRGELRLAKPVNTNIGISSIITMRITEILFWNNEPGEANDYEPQLDQAPARSSDDVTNLATAFTRRGMVKHFWNLNGSEGQPTVPAPPDAEPELIPGGTLEPITPQLPGEPVGEERPVGLHRFMPSPQY
jgi:hypothetical protein